MKVLVLGSGGREHALVWRLAQSPSVKTVYAAPGNPGMAAQAECLTGAGSTPEELVRLAVSLGVDYTVVGPEAPLVAGVVDAFRAINLPIVGPTAAAARLEGSKIFSKSFMQRHGIPTAAFLSIENMEDVQKALDQFRYPMVLKADGLAAGKGVIVAQTRQEAESVAQGLLSGQIVGTAGSRLVIEEFLAGEEVSFIALTDGKHVVPLQPTQDHKAIGDGDKGPNTGGMGAYCDSRILGEAETEAILDVIVRPTIEGMREEGTPFTGFLYAGLMMTSEGPKTLEFNVRLGDPETQPLMHRMLGDFGDVMHAAAHGDLSGVTLGWRPEPSVCVVLAAQGYPGAPRKGDPIRGIEEAEALGVTVFHAGTRLGPNGIETAGGRVLGVTARGADLPAAIAGAYVGVDRIDFDGMQIRKDIGQKGLKRWSIRG